MGPTPAARETIPAVNEPVAKVHRDWATMLCAMAHDLKAGVDPKIVAFEIESFVAVCLEVNCPGCPKKES